MKEQEFRIEALAALREAHELIDCCKAMLKLRGNWSETEDATIEQIETVLKKYDTNFEILP